MISISQDSGLCKSLRGERETQVSRDTTSQEDYKKKKIEMPRNQEKKYPN